MNTSHTNTTATKKTRTRKTKIEKEIEKAQKSNDFMIPKSCFKRLIREYVGPDLRVTSEAAHVLQEEAEAVLVGKLKKANMLAKVAKRDTLTAEDLKMVSFFENN